MSRLLVLHARARRVPEAVLGVVVCAALAAWAGTRLMERPYVPGFEHQVPVALLAVLVAAGAAAVTLVPDDPWLERSTPQRWRLWQGVHLTTAGVVVAAALLLAGTTQADGWALALCRTGIGLLAVGALGGLAAGRAGAALAPLAYAALAFVAAPPSGAGSAAWAWPLQPTAAPAATVTVILLAVAALSRRDGGRHVSVGVGLSNT